MVDLVFGKYLVPAIDQHLDVLKLELRIERAMEKAKELGDLGGTFQHRRQSDRGEVWQLQRALRQEQGTRLLGRAGKVGEHELSSGLHEYLLVACFRNRPSGRGETVS